MLFAGGARPAQSLKRALEICVTFMERRLVDCGKTASTFTDVVAEAFFSITIRRELLRQLGYFSFQTRRFFRCFRRTGRHRAAAPFEIDPLLQQNRRITEAIGKENTTRLISQLGRRCAERLCGLAESLIKRDQGSHPRSQRRFRLLRFLARIIKLDSGRCQFRIELFGLAPERPKSLEDVFRGVLGHCRIRQLGCGRFVEPVCRHGRGSILLRRFPHL